MKPSEGSRSVLGVKKAKSWPLVSSFFFSLCVSKVPPMKPVTGAPASGIPAGSWL